jgi:hypothetical protein
LLTTPNSITDNLDPDNIKPALTISKCMECGSEFADFHKFKLHVFKVHIENRRYPECDICFELFSSGVMLSLHKRKIHPGKALCKCASKN